MGVGARLGQRAREAGQVGAERRGGRGGGALPGAGGALMDTLRSGGAVGGEAREEEGACACCALEAFRGFLRGRGGGGGGRAVRGDGAWLWAPGCLGVIASVCAMNVLALRSL